MAKIVLVHGAFNELWGPHEIEAQWLPARRDGLWHRGRTIGDGDVAVCFYGDLFRRDPQATDEAAAQSREHVAAVVAVACASSGPTSVVIPRARPCSTVQSTS